MTPEITIRAVTLAILACIPHPSFAGEEVETPPAFAMPPSAPVAGVRKITDGGLSCGDLFAESSSLEGSIVARKAEADAAMKQADAERNAIVRSAGSGSSAAIGLLGMVPGAGMVSGLAAQAAAQGQLSAIQEASARMAASARQAAQLQEEVEFAKARNDHVIALFERKGCKPPAAPAPSAR